MMASTPVIENWLVTVNGCAASNTPKGIMPMKFENRMKVNTVKIQGMYFLPSGPILPIASPEAKPVSISAAACQRPGISSRFIPPHMNNRIAANTISIHNALLVKMKGVPSSAPPPSASIWN